MQRNNKLNDVIVCGMVGACLAVSTAVSGCSNNLSTICKIAAVIEASMGGSVQTMARIAGIGVTGFYCLARMFPAENNQAANVENQVAARPHRH